MIIAMDYKYLYKKPMEQERDEPKLTSKSDKITIREEVIYEEEPVEREVPLEEVWLGVWLGVWLEKRWTKVWLENGGVLGVWWLEKGVEGGGSETGWRGVVRGGWLGKG